MIEIINNAFLGPISDIYKKNEMEKIDVIVNCTNETYQDVGLENTKDKVYYCIPVDDTELPENINTFLNHAPGVVDICSIITTKAARYSSTVLKEFNVQQL
jgi:hypothetical protein